MNLQTIFKYITNSNFNDNDNIHYMSATAKIISLENTVYNNTKYHIILPSIDIPENYNDFMFSLNAEL